MKKFFVSFACLFVLISSFSIFAADYQSKTYLWRGVKGMDTQLRDTVLYHFPVKSEKVFSAAGQSSDTSTVYGKKPAVIICPGGSYHHLGIPHEGFTSAEWFNSIGVEAFVLQYRVAYNCHHYPCMLEDFQMAIKYIRENAEKFGVDKTKIGAIGFSAGGHLVTMAGEFADRNELEKLGVTTQESLRPDYVMPIYPVVTMDDDIGHKWSRKSLLGHQFSAPEATKGFGLFNIWGHAYSQELKDKFSMEKNVPENMPPVFILACIDDPVVIYENSVRLEKALAEKNIAHKFVTYPKGGHGFGMKKDSYIMKNHHWNDNDLLPWLKEIGVISE